MNHANAELIHTFYQAFQRLDAEAMAACYSADVRFSDPVFVGLQGREAGDMWRMLCTRAADFSLTYGEVEADDRRGSAQWVARYTFSQTGRTVVNVIRAEFVFGDGGFGRFVKNLCTRLSTAFVGNLVRPRPRAVDGRLALA